MMLLAAINWLRVTPLRAAIWARVSPACTTYVLAPLAPVVAPALPVVVQPVGMVKTLPTGSTSGFAMLLAAIICLVVTPSLTAIFDNVSPAVTV